MRKTSPVRTVASAVALSLLASGCGLFGAGDDPITGANADNYNADLDNIALPPNYYMPQNVDFPATYVGGNVPEQSGTYGDYQYGEFCNFTSDLHQAALWVPDDQEARDEAAAPGEDGLLDLGQYSFYVTQLDTVEEAEAEFDKQVALVAACNELDSGIDSISGALASNPTPVEGLGDEAVRADVMIGLGWYTAMGDMVVVRDGNIVMAGNHGFISSVDGDAYYEAADSFTDEEGFASFPADWSRDGAESAVRSVLKRLDNVQPEAITVREVHADAIIVENTGDFPLISISAVTAEVGDDPYSNEIARAVLQPGEKMVISFDTSKEFSVVGLETDLTSFDFAVVGELLPGEPFAVEATGNQQQFGSDRSKAFAFIFRDEDGAVIDTQVEYLPDNPESFDETTKVAVYKLAGTLRDQPRGVTVEAMRH